MAEKSKTVDEQFFKTLIAEGKPVSAEEKFELPKEPFLEKPEEKTVPRSKRNAKDYETVFLKKNELADRRSTYVSVENHEKLTQIINLLGNRNLSVGGYIDNLLTLHFEEYNQDISLLLDKKFKKLF